MATFRQAYCEQNHCDSDQFDRRVFWHSLYPHAWPIAALLLAVGQRRFFRPDEVLIQAAGAASCLRAVREDVRDYFWDSNNREWLRRVARIRVSGQRLKNLARRYVPEVPPAPDGDRGPAQNGPDTPLRQPQRAD